MKKFKIGDVVILKGDTFKTLMTVNKIVEYDVECIWFKECVLYRELFDCNVLNLVQDVFQIFT